MSKRTHRQTNRTEHSLGRRRLAKRSQALCEALEIRRLLSSAQPYVWTNTGIGGTGTDYHANVNPLNSQDIYLDTDMSEVWHTTNDGLTWATVNQFNGLTSKGNENFVQFTNNVNTQYAIDNADTEPMVTTNDGTTWTELPGYSAIQGSGIYGIQIAADPNSSQRIIVTQYSISGSDYDYWIWYSSNGGSSLTTGPGTGWQLISSSTTGTNPNEIWTAGSFWDTASGGSNAAYFATDMGLFATPNVTAATPTWTADGQATSGSGFYSFAGSETGGTTTLWGITWSSGNFDAQPDATGGESAQFTGIWTSSGTTNAGTSWTNMTADGPDALIGGVQTQVPWGQTSGAELYPISVQMANGNVNDVWIGGDDTNSNRDGSTYSPIVYSSTDAGVAWTRLLITDADSTYFPETPNGNVFTRAYGYYGQPQTDWSRAVTFFILDPNNPDVMTFSSQGTVMESADGGTYWYDIAAGGPQTPTTTLPNGLVFEAVTTSNPDPFFSNTSSDGIEFNETGTYNATTNPYAQQATNSYSSSSMNETAIWNLTFTNYDSESGIFADDTDVTYEQSSNGGADWTFPSAWSNPPANTTYQSVWVPSTGMLYAVTSDKHNLYMPDSTDDGAVEDAGADYVMMSSNDGYTWEKMYAFPQGSAARTIALDPNNPDVAFVGTANHNPYPAISTTAPTVGDLVGGGIWMTTDLQSGAGATWTYLGDGNNAAATATMDITNSYIVNGGSGYTSIPNITFSSGSAAASVSAVVNGGVNSLTLTSGGSGYTSQPTITFSAPPTGGTTATGVAEIINPGEESATITNIYITNSGSGYTSAPTISLGTTGGGTGFRASCTIANGVIQSINVTTPGSGYTSDPTMSFANGGGSGASAIATMSISSLTLTNGGTGYGADAGSTVGALFQGGDDSSGAVATATPTLSSGSFTGFSSTSGGSGYTSVPSVTLYSQSLNAQPSRLLNSSGTASGSIQTFSADHPLELYVLNSSTGSTLNVLAVMAERDPSSGAPYAEAGVWSGTSTNSGATWTWTDMSGDNGTTSQFVSLGTNTMPENMTGLTIDPNVSAQSTWFATAANTSVVNAGDIYETTNSGATWSVYSTVGQGYAFWIQPGGTEALFGIKYGQLMYTPNYTAANPEFYPEQGFPFETITNIVSNPYNTNQVWITTFGDGMWYTNISDIALAAAPQNVTAQAIGPNSALVSWTEEAPTPDTYTILASTSSTNWSSAITTSVTYAPQPLGVGATSITDGGTGYTSTPLVTVSGGGGTGAIAYASVNGTSVTAITIVNPGTGYTSASGVTFTITGGGGTGATASCSSLLTLPASATITGLSADTVYYFEMEAVDSAGTSGASNVTSMIRTDSNAANIATEGFVETTGNLSGATGGTGWSGAWTATTQGTIAAGNLTLAENGVAPLSAGNNHAAFSVATTASRTLDTSVGSSGTVLWAGFEEEIQKETSLTFGTTTTGFGFGSPGDIGPGYGASGISFIYNATTVSADVNEPFGSSSDVFFLVARMDFESSGTYVNLYLNPTPGTVPTATSELSWASGGTTLYIPASTWTPTPTDLVTLVAGGGTEFDEIRLGNTYGDVAPSAGIPAAPSNLIATPSTSSVALTWTDPSNTSNITGYHVWRSTNNSSWGASAYATVSGSSASSYTDTAPTSGTTYYYEITSYNGAGDSTTAAGMTCGVATVYAYEGFNYPTASTWSGGNTGVGFSGNWSISNSSDASIVGGLSYTSGNSALTTSGNSISLTKDAIATNTLSSSVGQTGSTLWIGFEFESTTTAGDGAVEVDLGTSTNLVRMGMPWNTDINARVVIGSADYYMTSSSTINANQVYFVVYEIQYNTSGDVISLYADPTTLGGTAPSTPTSTLTLPSSAQLTPTSTVELKGNYTYVDTYDELRLGATYGAVAPDPLVGGDDTSGGGTGDSGASSKRRAARDHRTTPFLASTPTHKHAKSSDIVTQAAKTTAPSFYPGSGGAWRLVNDNAESDALFSAASNDANGIWQGLFNRAAGIA